MANKLITYSEFLADPHNVEMRRILALSPRQLLGRVKRVKRPKKAKKGKDGD